MGLAARHSVVTVVRDSFFYSKSSQQWRLFKGVFHSFPHCLSFIMLLFWGIFLRNWASVQELARHYTFPPHSSEFPVILLLWSYCVDLFSSISARSTKVCLCCCLWGTLHIFETYLHKKKKRDTNKRPLFVAGYYNWPSLRRFYFPTQLKTGWKVAGLQNSGRWWHTANKQGLVLGCQSEGLKAFEQRISILPPARSSRPQSENPVRYHLQSSRIRGNFSKALY